MASSEERNMDGGYNAELDRIIAELEKCTPEERLYYRIIELFKKRGINIQLGDWPDPEALSKLLRRIDDHIVSGERDDQEAMIDYFLGQPDRLVKALERYLPPGALRDFTQKIVRGEFKRPRARPQGSGYGDSFWYRGELAMKIYELRKAGTTYEQALLQVAKESGRSPSTLRDYYRQIRKRVNLDIPASSRKSPPIR
jgi:hypothetical protein